MDVRADIDSVTNFMIIDTLLMGRPDLTLEALRHLVLPAIALGLFPLAIIARVTRASVLEMSNADHVRTARSKGLTEDASMPAMS